MIKKILPLSFCSISILFSSVSLAQDYLISAQFNEAGEKMCVFSDENLIANGIAPHNLKPGDVVYCDNYGTGSHMWIPSEESPIEQIYNKSDNQSANLNWESDECHINALTGDEYNFYGHGGKVDSRHKIEFNRELPSGEIDATLRLSISEIGFMAKEHRGYYHTQGYNDSLDTTMRKYVDFPDLQGHESRHLRLEASTVSMGICNGVASDFGFVNFYK